MSHKSKSKDFKERNQANINKKKEGIVIIALGKTKFKLKRIKVAQEGCFIARKDPVYQKEITQTFMHITWPGKSIKQKIIRSMRRN